MQFSMLYSIAADIILVTHVLFVVFMVLGLILIYAGAWLSWHWVINPWFRLAHLFGIGVVVVQSWFGITCPLTSFEMLLRTKAGEVVYQGTFIAQWMNALLYYEAPWWVFVVCYTVFGCVVIGSWFVIRPRAFWGVAKK